MPQLKDQKKARTRAIYKQYHKAWTSAVYSLYNKLHGPTSEEGVKVVPPVFSLLHHRLRQMEALVVQ